MMTRRTFVKTSGAALASIALPLSPSQAQNGFWVPGEEEQHEATFMQWPNSRRVYDDAYFLADTQQTIAVSEIRAISFIKAFTSKES